MSDSIYTGSSADDHAGGSDAGVAFGRDPSGGESDNQFGNLWVSSSSPPLAYARPRLLARPLLCPPDRPVAFRRILEVRARVSRLSRLAARYTRCVWDFHGLFQAVWAPDRLDGARGGVRTRNGSAQATTGNRRWHGHGSDGRRGRAITSDGLSHHLAVACMYLPVPEVAGSRLKPEIKSRPDSTVTHTKSQQAMLVSVAQGLDRDRGGKSQGKSARRACSRTGQRMPGPAHLSPPRATPHPRSRRDTCVNCLRACRAT